MKTKYVYGHKKYTYVECETTEEVKTVEALNKDMEAFSKSEQRYKERTVSINHKTDKNGQEVTLELPDNSYDDPLTSLIKRERLNAIHDALEQVTPRQKEIFLMVLVEDMSYSEIGRKLSISKMTVCESFNSCVSKIKEICKNM